MSIARTLLVNTGSNLSVMAIKLVLTFVMTPIFVHNMGMHDYGIWEMLGAVIGYMGLLDVGLRPTLSRYAAHYHAKKDQYNLEVTFASGLMFMCGLGALLFAGLALWGLFAPGVLAEGQSADTWRYTALLIIIGLQLLISVPGAVAQSYFEGLQKYYLLNNFTIFNSVVGSAVVYLYITPENALVLLAAVNAIGISSKYIIFHFLLSRPQHGGVRWRRGYFSLERLKELLVFGGKSFVQGISSRVESATDSLVIGTFMGAAMVPLYSIPANLVGYLRTFGFTITHAFMPLFSQLNAQDAHEKMLDIYVTCSRLAVGLILPMSVGVCLVGAPFIALWLGDDFRENADAIIILLVLFTSFPALNPFSSRYLTAINEHAIFAKLTPISALINLGCSIALVKPFGIVGVAIGSVIPVLIFVPIYLRHCCKHLGITMWHYVSKAILPVILPTMIMAAVVLPLRLYWGMDSYVQLVVSALAGMLAYFAAFWLMALSVKERTMVKGLVAGKLAKKR